ncbi:unnamed protein product [Protopolystoma xenopodis]|uniref:G-protein coupled receptors family 1 profile domain-containing protein n=1 Tax=Protopolystoma xenopodis TaxID=117903 RepID=A0A3S5A3G4_9PLAT|nr:unnamed protein product [Protopolystoma xenopodis]
MLISTTLQTPHATTTRKDEWSWQPESWGNHTAGDRPAWLIQLDWFSFAVCLSLGLAGNCLLLVQLVRVHLNGPRKTANAGRASNLASGERIRRQRGLLLGHQCVIDWLVCFITAIKLAGQNDGLGVNVSEHRVAAVCYLWSNNLLFWLLVITSVYGHVFIGLHTIYIFVSKLSRRSRGKWRDIQEILVIVSMSSNA